MKNYKNYLHLSLFMKMSSFITLMSSKYKNSFLIKIFMCKYKNVFNNDF